MLNHGKNDEPRTPLLKGGRLTKKVIEDCRFIIAE